MTTDSTLMQRLRRLMLFRVVMVTTLLLVAVYVETVSETLLRVNTLYLLVAATYALTIVHVVLLRFLPYLEPQVYVQVVGDLAIITGLVYLTGGTVGQAGFMLLYPISVLSGSVLLYRGKGLVLAGLATLFYAGMVWAVRVGWLHPQGLGEIPQMPAKHVLYSIFVTGVACVTVALIGSYLSSTLKTVGDRLVEATEQVADLQELNNVIVDSIQSGLLTTEPDGRVRYVNGFGASILARRAPEIRGRPVAAIFESWDVDLPALTARGTDGRVMTRIEVPYVRPDGRSLHLGVSVSRLATADPDRGGHLLVFQDLTEIKRLENDVRVKEKLAAVGEMAAHLAHEIRNPLGSISGSAQMLLAGADVSEEQGRLLAIITRESKRLSDTLNQFLFQARPAVPPSSPVDLRPVIAEAVTLLRNGPEVGAGHTVEFEASEGALVCPANRDQIAQVFWNLARNGLEAMPQGGALRIKLFRQSGDIVLAVQDQGSGIGKGGERRLFEPFQSGHMGTGLGLAIVYSIVRAHRGDISVRSTPAEGTEVAVRLPSYPAATQEPVPPAGGPRGWA